jgi:hypothetical protein
MEKDREHVLGFVVPHRISCRLVPKSMFTPVGPEWAPFDDLGRSSASYWSHEKPDHSLTLCLFNELTGEMAGAQLKVRKGKVALRQPGWFRFARGLLNAAGSCQRWKFASPNHGSRPAGNSCSCIQTADLQRSSPWHSLSRCGAIVFAPARQ